jgi:hypothetical protein
MASGTDLPAIALIRVAMTGVSLVFCDLGIAVHSGMLCA